MVWRRTRKEIIEALDIQRLAIEVSCKSYDEGNQWEALRLATAVYLVVHDRGANDRSLLTQLDAKSSMMFLASAPPADENNMLRVSLAGIRLNIGADPIAQYVPKLGLTPETHRRVPFKEWWEDELIFRFREFSLNRRKLVFTLRSQEGGAHFDIVQQNPNYEELARHGRGTPMVLGDENAAMPILKAELASMRQIAWELLESLAVRRSSDGQGR
jgi:hypothetical protein